MTWAIHHTYLNIDSDITKLDAGHVLKTLRRLGASRHTRLEQENSL